MGWQVATVFKTIFKVVPGPLLTFYYVVWPAFQVAAAPYMKQYFYVYLLSITTIGGYSGELYTFMLTCMLQVAKQCQENQCLLL